MHELRRNIRLLFFLFIHLPFASKGPYGKTKILNTNKLPLIGYHKEKSLKTFSIATHGAVCLYFLTLDPMDPKQKSTHNKKIKKREERGEST